MQTESPDLNDLYTKVLQAPEEGKRLLDQAMNSELFSCDPFYQVRVLSFLAIYYAITGQYEKAIPLTQSNILKAEEISDWLRITTNYNTLANVYSQLYMMDQAIECHQRIIQLSIAHNIPYKVAIAYNNMGVLFRSMNDYPKAMDYFEQAVEELSRQEDIEKQRHPFLNFASNLAMEYSRNKQFEQAASLLESLEAKLLATDDGHTRASVLEARMYYHLHHLDFQLAEDVLKQIVALHQGINAVYNYLSTLAAYVELAQNLGADPVYYLPYALEALPFFSDEHPEISAQIYQVLWNVWQQQKDEQSLFQHHLSYVHYMQLFQNLVRKQQRNAVEIVFDIEEARKENLLISEQNKELRRLTQEANERKQELSQAYSMLETIAQIGQKITSTQGIPQIAAFVYESLHTQMPLSSFMLMVVNDDRTELESVYVLDEGTRLPNRTISIDDSHSVMAKCYRENKTIISNHIQEDPSLSEVLIPSAFLLKAMSAIYIPLTYEGRTVGVCTLQHPQKDSYTAEHITFLEYLKPFLAISLFNAVRSRHLTSEIAAHKETQSKLEKVNAYLKRISSIDGLTGVNNRRLFDSTYGSIVEKAETQQDTLTVMMVDIDYFKHFNDFYGHLRGDEVLKQIAVTLQTRLESFGALFARFGGEEFICVVRGLEHQEDAKTLSDLLIYAIRDLDIRHVKAPLGTLTISVGTTFCQRPMVEKKADYIRLADECLYEAKNSDRNLSVVRNFE